MANWKEAKKKYIAAHLAKKLADHSVRLNALKKIEQVFAEQFSQPLLDENLFTNISKPYLTKLYECLKGSRLNGAEQSVFTGLYKFSV